MSEEKKKKEREEKRSETHEHFLKMRLYKLITIVERRTK